MPIRDYSLYQPIGFEGQIYGLQATQTDIRGTMDESLNTDTARIPYGRAVCAQGGSWKNIVLAKEEEPIVGVSVFTNQYEKDNGVAGVPVGEQVGFMRQGIILMVAETALTANAAVFVRVADEVAPTTFQGRGRLRADASAGKAVAFPQARVTRNCVAGAVVPVEIKF